MAFSFSVYEPQRGNSSCADETKKKSELNFVFPGGKNKQTFFKYQVLSSVNSNYQLTASSRRKIGVKITLQR